VVTQKKFKTEAKGGSMDICHV